MNEEKVSEELNSVETHFSHLLFRVVGLFQKNLIVWKRSWMSALSVLSLVFQKNLIVWKQYLTTRKWNIDTKVSEELNSVETRASDTGCEGTARFQKNLIVWKLRLGVTTAQWLATFQKNLIVWKRGLP